jgi:hypothetical protein
MKELIKITMIVTLVTGLLLLMGCGKAKEDSIGAVDAFGLPTSGNTSFNRGNIDMGNINANSNSYVATSADGEWQVVAQASPVDPYETRNNYIPVSLMQIQLKDMRCGQVYSFQKRNVFPQVGSVTVTDFLEARNPQIRLRTDIFFEQHFPGQRKILGGAMDLYLPGSISCRNLDGTYSGNASLEGFQNPGWFRQHSPSSPNWGGMESMIRIQLQ